MNTDNSQNPSYKSLPLLPEIQRAIDKKGYTQTTSVQALAIPPLLEGKDVLAKAPTGTGKTFAFGIPLLQQIDPHAAQLQSLILAPTRELALQIRDELRDLCAFHSGVRICCLYGGQEISKQITQLKKTPQVIVATPGRLGDHIKRHTVRLETVETIVLDEADRMVDMGFIKEVSKILDLCKNRKNLAMFSATISRELMDMSWVHQRDPIEITIEPQKEDKPDIKQVRFSVKRENKLALLQHLMKEEGYQRLFIFCNTKNMTDRLQSLLEKSGTPCGAIHGDIPQKLRERALKQFKTGEFTLLVCTDVAARGLDIDDVDAVVNYDVPDEIEYYIHRIGRTGRAKRHGIAYTFVADISESVKLDDIAKITQNQITEMPLPKSISNTNAKTIANKE